MPVREVVAARVPTEDQQKAAADRVADGLVRVAEVVFAATSAGVTAAIGVVLSTPRATPTEAACLLATEAVRVMVDPGSPEASTLCRTR